jgi:hypothetical protein
MIAKFSELLRARPPATTILAEASSGRSDLITSSDVHTHLPASKPDPGASDTVAEPPVSDAFSNAVVRTVMTCFDTQDRKNKKRIGNVSVKIKQNKESQEITRKEKRPLGEKKKKKEWRVRSALKM